MNTLAQSERYWLGHDHETVLLVKRATGKERVIADHYCDPTCGLIGPGDAWFVVGGEGVTVLDSERGSSELFRKGCPPDGRARPTWFVHALRLEGPDEVRILFDPWSDYASVWRLRVSDRNVTKIQDGPSLVGQPYRADVPF